MAKLDSPFAMEEAGLPNEPIPGRHLLVATTGGHLAQLVKWSSHIGSNDDSLWITFRTPQSESLLHDRRVIFMPYVGSRDFKGASKAFLRIMKDVDWRKEKFVSAVSTGAAVGVMGLSAARLHGIPSFFFETVSRVSGPTLSGKMASYVPGIQTFCQYESWAGGRWRYRPGSLLLDSYSKTSRTRQPDPSIFVTLGTGEGYRFDALVDAVLATGLPDERTVWQLGFTTREGIPGRVVDHMPYAEFEKCARDADVVVTHAGVGSLMSLLDLGVCPVVIPRRAKRNEVVDDHQLQIAALLQERGIAVVAEPEELTADTLVEASSRGVESSVTGQT
jgi:UDP-N-acetylglucosamine transferase subunit ALG13